MDQAIAYRVWQVDCHACGSVISYDDTHPDRCEDCGAEVEERDS